MSFERPGKIVIELCGAIDIRPAASYDNPLLDSTKTAGTALPAYSEVRAILKRGCRYLVDSQKSRDRDWDATEEDHCSLRNSAEAAEI